MECTKPQSEGGSDGGDPVLADHPSPDVAKFARAVCEEAYDIQLRLSHNTAVPFSDPYYQKSMDLLIDVCWQYRFDPELVLRLIAERADATVEPRDIMKHAANCTEEATHYRRPFSMEQGALSAEIDSIARGIEEFERDGLKGLDAFRACLKKCTPYADVSYLVGRRNGYTTADGKIPPAAIWFMRVRPVRAAILQKMLPRERT